MTCGCTCQQKGALRAAWFCATTHGKRQGRRDCSAAGCRDVAQKSCRDRQTETHTVSAAHKKLNKDHTASATAKRCFNITTGEIGCRRVAVLWVPKAPGSAGTPVLLLCLLCLVHQSKSGSAGSGRMTPASSCSARRVMHAFFQCGFMQACATHAGAGCCLVVIGSGQSMRAVF